MDDSMKKLSTGHWPERELTACQTTRNIKKERSTRARIKATIFIVRWGGTRNSRGVIIFRPRISRSGEGGMERIRGDGDGSNIAGKGKVLAPTWFWRRPNKHQKKKKTAVARGMPERLRA